MTRTPYGITPYGVDNYPSARNRVSCEDWRQPRHLSRMAIFVQQDVRSKLMSEGVFSDVTPHRKQANSQRM